MSSIRMRTMLGCSILAAPQVASAPASTKVDPTRQFGRVVLLISPCLSSLRLLDRREVDGEQLSVGSSRFPPGHLRTDDRQYLIELSLEPGIRQGTAEAVGAVQRNATVENRDSPALPRHPDPRRGARTGRALALHSPPTRQGGTRQEPARLAPGLTAHGTLEPSPRAT